MSNYKDFLNEQLKDEDFKREYEAVEIKLANKIYPAIFHKQGNGYWVEFPDLGGCVTQGESLEEALRKAKEALALGLDGLGDVVATPIENITVADGDRVLLVEADSTDDIEYFME